MGRVGLIGVVVQGANHDRARPGSSVGQRGALQFVGFVARRQILHLAAAAFGDPVRKEAVLGRVGHAGYAGKIEAGLQGKALEFLPEMRCKRHYLIIRSLQSAQPTSVALDNVRESAKLKVCLAEIQQRLMTISRIGQRRQVVIPKRAFEALQLREGDFVEVTVEHGRLALQPKRLVDVSDILTESEAATVREGEAQLKSGRSKPWRTVRHELDR